MKNRTRWALGIGGVLVLSAAVSLQVEPPTPRPKLAEPEPFAVSTYTLYKDFGDNQIAAEQTYAGRPLQVHGVVETIAKTNAQIPYVKFASRELFGVQALFDDESTVANLANLRPGQYVHLICRYDSVQHNVVLRACRIH